MKLIKNKKLFAISGRRPSANSWGYNNKITKKIEFLLKKISINLINQYDNENLIFLSGMAQGVDIIWAEIARDLNIDLFTYIPCIDQIDKIKNLKEKQKYKELLEYSIKKKLIYNGKYKDNPYCMLLRNRKIIEDSDFSYIIWDNIRKGGTWNYIKQCQKLKKEFKIIFY